MASWQDPVKTPIPFITGRPDLSGPPLTPPSADAPRPPKVIHGDPDNKVPDGAA
jgi:hypothetical protein